MKAFLSSLFAALYERVIVHSKPTLIGLGLSIAVEAVNYSAAYIGSQPQPWAHVLASVLLAAGALLKSKQPATLVLHEGEMVLPAEIARKLK
jgi:hypothetical protein